MQAKACWCTTVKLRGRNLMNEGELEGKEMNAGEIEGKEMHPKKKNREQGNQGQVGAASGLCFFNPWPLTPPFEPLALTLCV